MIDKSLERAIDKVEYALQELRNLIVSMDEEAALNKKRIDELEKALDSAERELEQR